MRLVETITILVCLSAGFSYLNERYIKFPVTIGLMAIALTMSLVLLFLGKLGVGIEAEAESFIRSIDFDETLLHGILSFLLFAGALHVNLDDLLEQKWFIGTLACVGVLVSTGLVGLLVYAVLGWIGYPIPFIGCLLFGALISPTDPIAVLGILKKAKAPKQLAIKITGESLFNDGVGVAVFLVLMGVAETGSMTPETVGMLFVREAVGGALVFAVVGHQLGELAGQVVVARVAHRQARAAHAFGVAAGFSVGQLSGCLVGRHEARAAINHHSVFNALLGLAQVGLEHFELKADAPGLAAEHEFGVGKGHAVGIGLQGVAVVGVVVQLGPGIGQAAFVELGVGFHEGLACRSGNERRSDGTGSSRWRPVQCGVDL